MKASHSSKIAKKKISVDCGKYLLRTINIGDASDRWANWMADPEAVYMLNAPVRNMTKTDWKLEKTLERHVKSHSDGTMLDLCFFSQSRDDWRTWKRANLPEQPQSAP